MFSKNSIQAALALRDSVKDTTGAAHIIIFMKELEYHENNFKTLVAKVVICEALHKNNLDLTPFKSKKKKKKEKKNVLFVP